MDEGYIELNPPHPKVAPLSQSRRTAAINSVQRALAQASPLAIRFQKELIEEARASDDVRMKKLGFDASEAILDRFLGKATQTVAMDMNPARPILFDPKLAALRAGMEKALEAATGGEESAVDAFSREMTKGMVDEGGVTI